MPIFSLTDVIQILNLIVTTLALILTYENTRSSQRFLLQNTPSKKSRNIPLPLVAFETFFAKRKGVFCLKISFEVLL